VSDNQTDLAYQDVEDDLRRDRLNALWAAYGRYIIGTAVLIVILVAGNELYSGYIHRQQEARAEAYDKVVKDAEAANSLTRVDVWNDGLATLDGSYKILAQFKLAAAALAVGELDRAIETYDAIARDRKSGPLLASLAQFRAGTALLAAGEDLALARTRLTQAANEAAPFHFSAREQLAVLDMREGNFSAALQAVTELTIAEGVPTGIRERAQKLRNVLESAPKPAISVNADATSPTGSAPAQDEVPAEEEEGQN